MEQKLCKAGHAVQREHKEAAGEGSMLMRGVGADELNW